MDLVETELVQRFGLGGDAQLKSVKIGNRAGRRGVMVFQEIYLVTETLRAISAADVDCLEAADDACLPVGYASFIREFGIGTLNDFLMILPPSVIQNQRSWGFAIYDQERWHWDNIEIPSERRKNLVQFGVTIDGDTLAHSPDFPDVNFVFPRHSNVVYTMGPSLEDCLDWMFFNEVLIQRFKGLFFKPSDDQRPMLSMTKSPSNTLIKSAVKRLFEETLGGTIVAYDEDLDCFNRAFGAHLHLNVSDEDEIAQVEMDFDLDKARDFLDLLCPGLVELGFQSRHHRNLDAFF